MRLTLKLCGSFRGKRRYKDLTITHYNRKWRNEASKVYVDRLRVPWKVIAQNQDKDFSKLTNAIDTFENPMPITSLREQLVTQWEEKRKAQLRERLEKSFPQVFIKEKDLHGIPALVHSNDLRFSFGLNQASLLCKAQITQGPPQGSYKDLIIKLSKEDSLQKLRKDVEEAIFKSHIWDTEETKLPRRFSERLGTWNFNAEWGIHPDQAARNLGKNLFKIIDLNVDKIGAEISTSKIESDLRIVFDRQLSTSCLFNSKYNVHFMHQHPCVMMSSKATPVFLDSPPPEESFATALRELGPMEPTIDFTLSKIYSDTHMDGWPLDYKLTSPHVHSIFVNYPLPNRWSDFVEPEVDLPTVEQRQSLAMMHAFASCLATARRFHGNDYVEKAMRGELSPILPKPISVEVIGSDGVFFDFVCFELRTLDFSKPSDIASSCNKAWIDGDFALFKKILPNKRLPLKFTQYKALNMNVFARIFAAVSRSVLLEPVSKISSPMTLSSDSSEQPSKSL